MKKKKIKNRKVSFMVEPKDYRCSLSKLSLERKNDYLVAVTMRDKDAREIKSAMFYPDASCVLLVIGNYKKAPYTYKFQEIRDRKVTRVKNMSLAKFKYILDLFGGTPYITFKK